jgi:hypothetical protein
MELHFFMPCSIFMHKITYSRRLGLKNGEFELPCRHIYVWYVKIQCHVRPWWQTEDRCVVATMWAKNWKLRPYDGNHIAVGVIAADCTNNFKYGLFYFSYNNCRSGVKYRPATTAMVQRTFTKLRVAKSDKTWDLWIYDDDRKCSA